MKTQTLIAALLAAMTMLSGCVVAPAPVYREPVYVEPPPPRVEHPGYPPIVGYLIPSSFPIHQRNRFSGPQPQYPYTMSGFIRIQRINIPFDIRRIK
jgi:hypothetical protein